MSTDGIVVPKTGEGRRRDRMMRSRLRAQRAVAATSPPSVVSPLRWRHRSRLVRGWRLARSRHPVTFTEKVRYKMLRDHRPVVVVFADKAAVRDYVRSIVGDAHLPVAFGVLDDPTELLTLELPREFVAKPTHGSGALVIVTDAADADARLPPPERSWVACSVRPEHADRGELAAIGAAWLAQQYGQGPNNEWAYGRVPRRIIVEELLQDAHGSVPDDYKLFVFHGRCHFVQVDGNRFRGRTQDFFDPTWEHLALSGGPAWAPVRPPRPTRLAEMIDIAERLGHDTDFVRVDLYLVGDRVLVGELTNYPAGGRSPFFPESFDEVFGRPWRVPRRYRT